MNTHFAFRRIDAVERRHDGPIPPFDPAAPPPAAGRERLFRRLAAEQRADIARARRQLGAAAARNSTALARGQGRLRFYRDQGAAWAALGS